MIAIDPSRSGPIQAQKLVALSLDRAEVTLLKSQRQRMNAWLTNQISNDKMADARQV